MPKIPIAHNSIDPAPGTVKPGFSLPKYRDGMTEPGISEYAP